MIYWYEDDYEQRFVFGIGQAVKNARYGKSDRGNPYCMISAVVEKHPTGEKNERGYPVMKSDIMTISIFGKLSEYCKDIEKGDTFFFAGQVVVDEYWTNRSETGEVKYKCNAEYVSVQPDGMASYSSGGFSDMPESFYDEPPY